MKILLIDIIYVLGCGVSRKKVYRLVIVPFLISVNYTVTAFGIGRWGEMFTYIVSIFIITCFCYCVSVKRGILVATLSIFAIGTLEGVMDLTVGILLGKFNIFNKYVIQTVSDILIALFLFFVIRKSLSHMRGCLNYLKPSHGVYFVFVLVVNLWTMVGLYQMVKTDVIRESVRQRFLVIMFLTGISTLLQVTILMYLSGYHYLFREKELLIKDYLEQQEEYYKYLEKKEADMRKFQHDIRSHLGMLQVLSQQGKNLEMKLYLEQICGKINKIRSDFHTGSIIVDTILNYYASLCYEKKILFSVKASFLKQEKIEDYDICVIFSNLLRNAVEAAQNATEKEISMEVWYDQEAVYIIEENTFAKKPVVAGTRWLSAKREYRHSGYGLGSIQECVDKYQGSFDYGIEKDKFYAMIVLYLEQGESW